MIKILSEDVSNSNLKELRNLAESSIGPNGRLKVLQTKPGSYALTTTTSSRLYDFIEAKDPISQILLAGFRNHQHLFHNGGLFLASLTCNLYLAHCESSLPRNICIEINNYVHEKMKKKLEEKDFTRELDIGKVNDMLILVRSILKSKPVCQLSEEEIDHLSISILKAFFMNADSEIQMQCGLLTVPVEGPSTIQSHLISGIVLNLPTVNSLSEKLLSVCREFPKIVVITASLAGDQHVIDENLFSQHNDTTSLDGVTFGVIWRLVESIVSVGANIVCCQKVVHPSVRKCLEEKSILVIERIGYQLIRHICSVTKVQRIESIFDKVTSGNISTISNTDTYEFSGKRYLILRPCSQNYLHTMMLCGSDENTLDELKSVLLSIEKSLYHVIKEPEVVFGGGCFETQVATFVRHMERKDFSIEEKVRYRRLLELPEAHWLAGLHSIAKSFIRIARSLHKQNGDCYIDTTYHHLWMFPKNTEPTSIDLTGSSCCCGIIDYAVNLCFQSTICDETILGSFGTSRRDVDDIIPNFSNTNIIDSFYLKRESICSAFELNNTVLRVGCAIESQNS